MLGLVFGVFLAKQGVQIHVDCKCEKVEESGVTCAKPDGTQEVISGDTIACALGLKPRTDVVDDLWGSAPKVFAIGNCLVPGTITNTVYQGYHAALDL